MKKTTIKRILASFCFFSAITISAQNSKTNIQTNNNNVNTPLELTSDSQKSLDETGYVRCTSVEMHQRRLERAGTTGYDDAFENWIAPLVEAKRIEIAEAKANGTFQKAVVNVPIIFHVITSGSGATNLSDAIIQAQIDQLNLDFSDQGGVNGTQSSYAVSADAEIVFVPATVDPNGNPLAVPGVNRVTTFGAGPFNTSDFDQGDGGLEIKPATIWDRSVYANVWTADISGGILGYAQFPSNSTLPGFPADGGSELNDGVVCGYGTIGSRDMPGSAPPYNLGRTLTHEIGHWIGLRHIWGDGNCNADDFVTDTPNAGSANYGCPTGTNSCTGGQNPGNDMIENYMDYTDDSCMDLFTAGQVTRIATVLTNADGISNLPNSTTADPVPPTIFFANTTLSAAEGSDCAFTDITIPLSLLPDGPSANAVAQISAMPSSTATEGADFDLMTPNVSFAANATGTQNMTVRIYSDSFTEGDETVVLNFSVNANGGDAIAGVNNTVTLTITDDDIAPTSTQNTTIFSDDFESYADFSIANVGNWTLIDNDGDATYASDNTNFTNEGYTGSFIVFNPGATTPVSNAGWNAHGGNKGFYCFNSNGSVSGSPLNDDFAITPQMSNGTNGEIKFWAKSLTDNYAGGERFRVGVSASNDGTGITYLTPNPYVIPPLTWTEYTYTIPASFDDSGVYVVFHVVSADEFVFMLDDVSVTSDVNASIQSTVNTGANSDDSNLSGTGIIYTADSSTGDFMLDIENKNTFNYGCTNVAVSRAGSGAQPYGASISPNLVMDKTFTITPTNTTTTGDVDITFYFEAGEISGWEGVTGLTNTSLVALRAGTGEVVPLTVAAFGSDITLKGTFTGVSGTYYFGPESAFRVRVSPKVYLQGAALNPNTGEQSLMRDDLRVAGYIPTTSPYDTTTCDASVFNVTGANAIVDWVLVELRDATTNTTVSASQSALLQRDGDVVTVDGTSSLLFNIPGKDYYVVIKHRNHLGVMAKDLVSLTATTTVVDFTNGTVSTFGTDAQTSFGMPSGVLGMWSGDSTGNGLLNYLGAQSDVPSIRSQVFNDPSNSVFGGPPIATYGSLGYYATDINMDGVTYYAGGTSDVLIVRNNIFNNPSNSVFGGPPTATYNFTQQLPEGTN